MSLHSVFSGIRVARSLVLSSPLDFSGVRVARSLVLSSPLVFSGVRVARSLVLSSPLVYSGVRVARSLVFYVMYCISLLKTKKLDIFKKKKTFAHF
jgi:hypothetical protein